MIILLESPMSNESEFDRIWKRFVNTIVFHCSTYRRKVQVMSRANKSHEYSQLMDMTDPDNSTLKQARGVQTFNNGPK